MNRWIKVMGWGVLGVLILGGALALILPRVLDPNAYRDDLIRIVSERTGRTLTLDGKLGLSVFPWLGLELNGVTLSNAPGFEDAPMLAVRHARAGVRLWPLLSGRLEFGTIALDGLQLNLARAADGRSNWQDIQERLASSDPQQPATPPAESSVTDTRFTLNQLDITGVRIREGRLLWDDRQGSQRYALTNWDLTTGRVRWGGAVPVSSSFTLSVGSPSLDAETTLEAKLQVAPDTGRYGVEDLVLETRLRSAELLGDGMLPLKLSGEGIWQADAPSTLGPVKLEIGPYQTANQRIEALVLAVSEVAVDVAQSKAQLKGMELAGQKLLWAGRGVESVLIKTAGAVDWGTGQLRLPSLNLEAAGLRLLAGTAPIALTGRSPVVVDWKRHHLEAPALALNVIGKLGTAQGQGLLNPTASGKLSYDWGKGQLALDALKLSTEQVDLGAGRLLPKTELAADVAGSTSSQRWSLKALRLSTADLFSAQGEADLTTSGQGLSYRGRIETPTFAPRPLLAALKLELPATAAPDTLRSLALNSAFTGTAERIALDSLRLDLDGGRMQGRAALAWGGRPRLETDLTVDRLNVDRYLPPAPAPDANAATSPKPAAASKPQPLPFAALRQFDLDARLAVGELTVSRVVMKDAQVRALLKDGRLTVDPLRAGLFGGNLNATVQVDASSATPTLNLRPELKGIQLAPLLTRFAGKAYLTGTGNLKLQATTRGVDGDQWLKNLDGLMALDLRNGRIENIDVLGQLRRSYAQLRALDPGTAPEGGTEFTEIKAGVAMKGSIWRNDDLMLTSPLLRMSGKGQIDVSRQQLDFQVLATLLGTGIASGDRLLDNLIDTPVPIRIDGPWASPSVRPDLKAMAEAKARERLEKEKDKLEEKLKEREDELRQKASEKLQERLEKFLR
ncbi:MAG: AsmA family protein [Candidatus Macondimonas sp.]